MRMNTSIPMMGQQADVVGSAARGFEAGRKNRLADIYNQHGAGIASGDKNALAALAQFDPTAAMQAKRGHQVMQHAEAQEGRNAQTFEMQLAEYAKGLDAAQAAKQAAQIEQGLVRATQLYHAGDLQGVNMLLAEAGEQPISDLQQFPAIAAQYEKAFTVLKNVKDFSAPDKPADEYGRYLQEEAAAGRQPLSRIDFAKAKQKSSTLSVDKDGNVTMTEGPQGGKPVKTTEGEKAAAGYLGRMRDAEKRLESLGTDEGPATRSVASLFVGGTDFESLVLSGHQQQVLQAMRDWVRAKLRKESGAVIGDEEMAEEVRTYFPLPGDTPEAIEQKRQSRMSAERQFETMGGAAVPEGGAEIDDMTDEEFLNSLGLE